MIHALELPDFSQTNILLMGDLMLDRYWSGSSNRISPEAPVPVVNISEQNTRAGGAANVAINLAAIHCQVDLLGIVGQDSAAAELQTHLQNKKITCHFHSSPDINTISKLRVMAQNQQMLRLDFESPLNEQANERLYEIYRQRLEHCNTVLLSDYGKGTLNPISRFIKAAQQKNIPVLIDPKGKDFSIYHGATLITPNLHEFETIVGHCGQNETLIVAKAKQLMQQHQINAILITRGKDGMSLVYADDRPASHLQAHAREVFDVTGAGDTVIAFMAAALSNGLSLERAAYLANVAAGLVVKKLGTATVNLAELRSALRDEYGASQGTLSLNELLSITQDAKHKGETIVMTNGCFDVLHPGHVQYLEQARELGDRLIVAVNTDASVKKLKGNSRPINPLASRMEVLAGLRSVDWVIPFAEDTPERLIEAIIPDILVKGGDYQVTEIAGHQFVQQNGGSVTVLPFYEGHSTTRLVKKIKEG